MCLSGLEGSRKAATKASTMSKPSFHRRGLWGAVQDLGLLILRPKLSLLIR